MKWHIIGGSHAALVVDDKKGPELNWEQDLHASSLGECDPSLIMKLTKSLLLSIRVECLVF